MNNPFTILLVEDDPTIRLATEYALTREGYAVTTAGTGTMALTKYDEATPDLILLDVMLPELSGFEIAQRIRESDRLTPIIMLTALGDQNDKVTGLDAGADDYLTKPFSTAELLARIRANLRRVEELNRDDLPQTLEYGDLTIDTREARVSVNGAPVDLRTKEYELLLFLARNPGMLATRQRISTEIWDEEFLTTSRTIDVHIRRLRSAIDPVSAYDYIHTVHGMGYRFEPLLKDTVNE